MSWDVVLFNKKEKIEDFESFDADELKPTEFEKAFDEHFDKIKIDGEHREIEGKDFAIVYFEDSNPKTNVMLSLYGENAIYELIYLAKIHGWQIFDTGNGEILDLDDPSNNGYEDFQNYLRTVLRK